MSTEAYTITMMNGSTITVLFGEAAAEQQIQCHTLSSSAWGSYLDEDEVIAREQHLSTTALARDGGCRTWCLYRQDDHSQILATCKTIRRIFFFRSADMTQQVEGCCISSVCTALVYRGHGLASYMLRNVAKWLDGPGGAFVSMLYSGMPQFYEKLGWAVMLNTEVALSIGPWLQDVLGPYADIKVRLLSDSDVRKSCAQAIEVLQPNHSHSIPTIKGNRLTVMPTAELVNYQHALSDYMGDLWHFEAPENRGAAFEEKAWLHWYHDFRGRSLRIQQVYDDVQDEEKRPDILAALFLSAIQEAKRWDFTIITTWDTSPHVRIALEKLAQASVFSKSVSESHRSQRIHMRFRDDAIEASSVVLDNTTYAWNVRY